MLEAEVSAASLGGAPVSASQASALATRVPSGIACEAVRQRPELRQAVLGLLCAPPLGLKELLAEAFELHVNGRCRLAGLSRRLVVVECHVLVDLLPQLAVDVEIGRVVDCKELLGIFLVDRVVRCALGAEVPALGQEGRRQPARRRELLRRLGRQSGSRAPGPSLGLPVPALSLELLHLEDVVVVAESVNQAVAVHLILVVRIALLGGYLLAGLLGSADPFLPEGRAWLPRLPLDCAALPRPLGGLRSLPATELGHAEVESILHLRRKAREPLRDGCFTAPWRLGALVPSSHIAPDPLVLHQGPVEARDVALDFPKSVLHLLALGVDLAEQMLAGSPRRGVLRHSRARLPQSPCLEGAPEGIVAQLAHLGHLEHACLGWELWIGFRRFGAASWLCLRERRVRPEPGSQCAALVLAWLLDYFGFGGRHCA